jgi:phosphatidylserine decarboxylase
MALVGATVVGSMATVWHGVVNPPRLPQVTEWHYDESNITLLRGEELGRFLLGSTVVMLFPKGALDWSAKWQATLPVRMGEAMAQAQ